MEERATKNARIAYKVEIEGVGCSKRLFALSFKIHRVSCDRLKNIECEQWALFASNELLAYKEKAKAYIARNKNKRTKNN